MIYFIVAKLKNNRGEFAMGTILGIAISIIIAAFVLIPQLRAFTEMILLDIHNWWSNTIRDTILVTS